MKYIRISILVFLTPFFVQSFASAENTADPMRIPTEKFVSKQIEKCEEVDRNKIPKKADRVIRAECLERLLEESKITRKAVNIKDARIKGQFKFSEKTIPFILKFENVKFDEYLEALRTTFLGGVKFKNVTFCKDANFTGADFSNEANFEEAEFYGKAFFVNAKFAKKADYSQAAFTQKANFEEAEFLEAADFFGAKFNGEAIFKSSQFAAQADFSGVKFSLIADSKKAELPEKTDFSDVEFFENAAFTDATFNGEANFESSKFAGQADFFDATFNGEAIFESSKFEGETVFEAATFSEKANFKEAEFLENADFFDAKFAGEAVFEAATFSEKANFKEAEFFEAANFSMAAFAEETIFKSSTFNGKASFKEVSFSEAADFLDASFSGAADFVLCRFKEKSIFRACLFPPENKIKFDNVSGFSIMEMEWDYIPERFGKEEDEKNIARRGLKRHLNYNETFYIALIKNYREMGWLREADDAYYTYRVEKRKFRWRDFNKIKSSQSNFNDIGRIIHRSFENIKLIFDYLMLDFTFGYGVKPRKLFRTLIFFWIPFAFYYVGFVHTGSGENLPWWRAWNPFYKPDRLAWALIYSLDTLTPGINFESFETIQQKVFIKKNAKRVLYVRRFQEALGWYLLALFLIMFGKVWIR
jgi:hypothetical protein